MASANEPHEGRQGIVRGIRSSAFAFVCQPNEESDRRSRQRKRSMPPDRRFKQDQKEERETTGGRSCKVDMGTRFVPVLLCSSFPSRPSPSFFLVPGCREGAARQPCWCWCGCPSKANFARACPVESRGVRLCHLECRRSSDWSFIGDSQRALDSPPAADAPAGRHRQGEAAPRVKRWRRTRQFAWEHDRTRVRATPRCFESESDCPRAPAHQRGMPPPQRGRTPDRH